MTKHVVQFVYDTESGVLSAELPAADGNGMATVPVVTAPANVREAFNAKVTKAEPPAKAR